MGAMSFSSCPSVIPGFPVVKEQDSLVDGAAVGALQTNARLRCHVDDSAVLCIGIKRDQLAHVHQHASLAATAACICPAGCTAHDHVRVRIGGESGVGRIPIPVHIVNARMENADTLVIHAAGAASTSLKKESIDIDTRMVNYAMTYRQPGFWISARLDV